MSDNLRRVYSTLQSEGYELPKYEEFAADMRDDKLLSEVRQSLVESGYTPPEFAVFKADMWGTNAAPAPADKSQYTFTGQQLGLEGEPLQRPERYMRTQQQTTLQTPMWGTITKGENKSALVRDMGESDGRGGISEYIEMLSGVKSEGQEKMEEQLRTAKERAARGEANLYPYGDTQRPLVAAPDIRVKTPWKQNLTNLTHEMAADKAVERAEEGLKPATDAWTQAQRNAFKEIERREREAKKKKAAEDAVGEMREKVKNLTEANTVRRFDPAFGEEISFNFERAPLTAADLILSQTEKMVEDFAASREMGGWANLGRSMATTVFDPKTWDIGLSDMLVADQLLSVVEKADKGEALSDSEQLLLDAAINQQVMQGYYGELSNWQKAGQMFGESLPFMVQIAANPLASLGKYASSKASKAVVRHIAKRVGEKGVKKILAKTAAVTGRMVGDLAGSYGVALTTNLGNTTADALNRQIGDIGVDYDDNGVARYDGRTNVMDAGRAWRDAVNNQAFEFYSEQMGAYFSPVLKGLGKIGGKTLNSFGMQGVNRWVSDFAKKGNVQLLNQFLDRTQFHGFASEYAEEIANDMLNAAFVGDMTMEEVFGKDNLVDTAIGLSVMGAIGPMVATAGYARAKHKEKQALNAADENGRRLMGHAWESFAEAVRRSKNGEELSVNLRETLNRYGRRALPGEDMRQILAYAQAYNRYKAVEEVSAKAVAEGVADERHLEQERLFDEGAHAENKNAVRVEYEEAVNGLGQWADIVENLNNDNALDLADDYEERGEVQMADAIRRFVNARSMHAGMTADIVGQARRELEAATAEIDAIANKKDGNIYSVTLGGGSKGYVTGGTIVTDEQGNIDENATREANEGGYLYIMQEGRVRQLVPEALVSLDNVESAEEAKAMREAEINASFNARYEELTAPVPEAAPAPQTPAQETAPAEASPTQTAAAPTAQAAPTASNEVAEDAARALGLSVDELNDAVKSEQKGLSIAAKFEAGGDTDGANAIRAYVSERFGTQAEAAPTQGNNGAENITIQGEANAPENITQAPENVAPAAIPVEKRGKEERQAFHLVPVERTTEELYNSGLDQREIDAFVQANIDEINGDIEKHNKKQPKMGANIAAYKTAKEQWQAEGEDLAARLSYYKGLQEYIKGITTSDTAEAINDGVADIGDITTPEEFIAAQLGGIKITPESFRKETGLSAAEQKALVGVIAGEDKGGVSVERAAEIITDNYSEELAGLGFKGDMLDVRDAIIEILSGGNPKTYAKRAAEARQQQVVDERRAQMDYTARQLGFDTVDELIAYEETILPRIIEQYAGYDEQTYYNILDNDYNDNDDTTRESETVGRGGNVLQGEEPVTARGIEPIGAGQQGGAILDNVQGSVEDAQAGEPVGETEELNQSEDNLEMGALSANEVSKEKIIGRSLSEQEAQALIVEMENNAEVAPNIELNIDNWDALFGEDGTVNTPIGEVKMGENQFAKLMRQGRKGKLGMIKPTLENPHAIVEETSEAKEGDTTERASSYIFIRSFKKADGSRFYYFTSITVSKDGREVVVSSQEKSRNKILRLLQEGSVIWRTPKDATTSSAERQGLDYEQPNEAETATKGSGITPQSTSSTAESTTQSSNVQENSVKSGENTQNSGEKDVIEEMREQNRVAEERQQRAGVPPRVSDYSSAINAEDTEAQKAWEDKFNDFLAKLTIDDLPTIDSTISSMQGNKEVIKAGDPGGYKENPHYKAFDYIEKALKKRKRELEKSSINGEKSQEIEDNSTTGGREDGARNYVIFDENDAQITDRVEFLRTSDGTVYGWTVSGKIFLTPEGVNPNTPVHEYTHLWASAIEQRDPGLWAEVVEAMKLSPVWADVMADEAYRDIWNDENRTASEVLSRLTGNENYRRTMQEAALKENDPTQKFSLIAAWGRVKRVLAKFWNRVREMLDLPVMGEPGNDVPAWERFVNSAIGDFYGGVNPNVKNSPMERMTMGSRVDARMAQVASELDGRKLTTEQQAVADVFGGKADNLTISVKTRDGNERKVVMRQGNEANAGAKHSLYRHFGTGVGVITSDDIISIPNVIANGVRTEKRRGITRLAEYKLNDVNGGEFTVLTEIKKGKEIFNDFYSNKKAPLSGTFNTQSAHTANNNALSANKGNTNSSNTQNKNSKTLFRSVGGNSGYVGYSMSKRAAEAREEGRYPKTDFKKEYNVPQQTLEALVEAGIIDNSEWHHTSKMGNRTTFYGWAEEGFAERYARNKKEIDKLVKEVNANIAEIEKEERDFLDSWKGYEYPETFDWDAYSRRARELEELPINERTDILHSEFPETAEAENHNSRQREFSDKIHKKKREQKKRLQDLLEERIFGEEARVNDGITSAVNALAAELNTDVEIVNEVKDIPDARKRGAKGWYENGRVYIVLPNATSVDDAVETVLHEVVGHKGLRALFGERFNEMLDNVFVAASKEVRKAILERAVPMMATGKDALRVATEEYMAEQAERGFDDYSLFDRIKGWFKNLLNSLGFNVELSDNDIRYMLWRSYNLLKGNNTLAEIENIAMQARLGVGEYRARAEVIDTRFRDTSNAQELYNKNVEGFTDRAKEAWIDKTRSVRKMQEAIEKETGEEIADYANVYLLMNQMPGRVREKMDGFFKKHFDPLGEFLKKMFKNDYLKGSEEQKQKQVERYLNCKHGIERNIDMSVRAALTNEEGVLDRKTYEQYTTEKEAIWAKNLPWAEEVKELTELSKKYNAKEKDYSGLTALFPNEDSYKKIRNEAVKSVENFEKAFGENVITELWKRVGDINKLTLKESYESGILSKELHNSINRQFRYYVPLRGFEETTASEVYEYLSREDIPISGPIRRAEGRKSEAERIFATMANMYNSAVSMGAKNRVKQALFQMAVMNKTPLLSVNPSYYKEDGRGGYEPFLPAVTEDMSEDEIRREMEKYEEDVKKGLEDGTIQRHREGLSIDYKSEKWQKDEHAVRVKRNGKEFIVFVNGNPRAAQAINGLLDRRGGKFIQTLQAANRWRARNITGYNVNFTLSNLARDIQEATITAFAKEGLAYTGLFEKELMKNLAAFKTEDGIKYRGIHNLYYRYFNDKLDLTNKREKYFKEFMENGGETGFHSMMSIEDYQKRIKKIVDSNLLNATGKGFAAVNDTVEFLNRGIENACRFATYVASRESGKSVMQSVNDAKEASVNFNRVGSGAMGNLYFRASKMFLNPAIQGLVKRLTLLRDYPARMIPIVAMELLTGYIVGDLAMMAMKFIWDALGVDDDDEENNAYYNLSDFVRRSNVVIPLTNGKFIKIPLSHESRVAHGIGEILSSYMNGHLEYENIPAQLYGVLTQSIPLNPTAPYSFTEENLLEDIAKVVIPDAFALPAYEALVLNRDFTGRSVTGRSDYNEHRPEYMRAGRGTPKFFIEMSRAINDWTGGSDIERGVLENAVGGVNNPTFYEYMLMANLGGIATMTAQIYKTVQAVKGDKEYQEARNYPIINRFFEDTSSYEEKPQKRTRRDYERAYRFFNEKTKDYSNIINNDKAAEKMGIDGLEDERRRIETEKMEEKRDAFKPHREYINDLYNELNKAKDEKNQSRIEEIEKEILDAKIWAVKKMEEEFNWE